jgi:signal transduction histidine kinase
MDETRSDIAGACDVCSFAEIKIANYFKAHNLTESSVLTQLYQLREKMFVMEADNASLQANLDHFVNLSTQLVNTVIVHTIELEKARVEAKMAHVAKSTFVTNVTHAFHTPMSIVIGYADILGRLTDAVKQQSYVDKIKHAAMHLLTQIDGVITISDIEAGKLCVENCDFVLVNLLKNQHDLIAHRIAEKKLLMVTEIAPKYADTTLIGDCLRIAQVLSRLVDNAVKFSETGTVTVRVIGINETSSDVELRFEVQDEGVGVPYEDQQRIFEPFEQRDNSTTRKHSGLGLGLSICKHLVALLNGEIGVESTPFDKEVLFGLQLNY